MSDKINDVERSGCPHNQEFEFCCREVSISHLLFKPQMRINFTFADHKKKRKMDATILCIIDCCDIISIRKS